MERKKKIFLLLKKEVLIVKLLFWIFCRLFKNNYEDYVFLNFSINNVYKL